MPELFRRALSVAVMAERSDIIVCIGSAKRQRLNMVHYAGNGRPPVLIAAIDTQRACFQPALPERHAAPALYSAVRFSRHVTLEL